MYALAGGSQSPLLAPAVQGDFNFERWHLNLLTIRGLSAWWQDLTSALSQTSAWILVILGTESTTLI